MFADPDMPDGLVEKIVAFVDREAGRDAPLTADDEAMVRELLEHDLAAQRLAEDLRATNAGLDTLLDDVAAVEVPEKLVALIRGHDANQILIADEPVAAASERKSDSGAAIVDLRRPSLPGFGYGGLAAAASLAFLVSFGALLYVYTTYQEDRAHLERTLAEASKASNIRQKELADASAEVQELTVLAERAVEESEHAREELTRRDSAIQNLEVERANLQSRHGVLLGENERLGDLVVERTKAFARVDQEREQVLADLSSLQEDLQAERGEAQRVRSLLSAQSPGLDALRTEQKALQNRIADLEAEKRGLASERDMAERVMEEVEQQLSVLKSNLLVTENARQATARRVSSLETDLAASRNWLGQISQYHRVYASTAGRHLVEVRAEEQEYIELWLGKTLKRPVPVPDLREQGLTFQGARLLGINEKPVAQLVYLDAEGRPLAFCLIPSTGVAQEPMLSTDRDLNLIAWRDGQHGYALVGWSDPERLETLKDTIRPLYDL